MQYDACGKAKGTKAKENEDHREQAALMLHAFMLHLRRAQSSPWLPALVTLSWISLGGCFLLIDLGDRQLDGAVDDASPDAQLSCAPDDTEGCYTGPPGSLFSGSACQEGTRTCLATGTWGPCEDEVTPEMQCAGRECGEDACGGSCGTCEHGVDCISLSGLCDRGTMVLIPSGTFDMGSEAIEHGSLTDENKHEVTLTRYFEIDRTEVTNQAYLQCVLAVECDPPLQCATGQSIWHSNDGFPISLAHHPVVCVSWDMALAYCSFVEKRLCTEAEWERACVYSQRHRVYPWGNPWPSNPAIFANCSEGYCFDGHVETSPVGSLPAGQQAELYIQDLAGNVGEWVSDWYSHTYYGVSPLEDPEGPCPGEYPNCSVAGVTTKVHRGGSWFLEKDFLRCSRRAFRAPAQKERWMGIRCCRDATDI